LLRLEEAEVEVCTDASANSVHSVESACFVNALVGMGTEVVALGLSEICGKRSRR